MVNVTVSKKKLFQMPKFLGLKVVHASQIIDVMSCPSSDLARIMLLEPAGMYVDVEKEFIELLSVKSGGWLISDRAGSLSYCPSKRFHDGHSLVKQEPCWGELAQYAINHTLTSAEIDLEAADFSDALMWLKEGKKVSRKGWNAGGQHCWMVHAADDSPYGDHFALLNAQNMVVPWQPSVGDVLACDWVVVA
ncbi:DUF2829 domain-containing protein [Enterobacter hormaechei]